MEEENACVWVFMWIYKCIQKDWEDNRPTEVANVCVFEKGKWSASDHAKKNFKDLSYIFMYCMSF